MRKLLYICLILTTVCCTSCTKLKSEMYNVINPSIFPKTEADAEALVTAAAYSPFISNWYAGLYTSWGPGGIHVYTEMTTDIGACQWNDSYWPDLRNVNFTSNSYAPTFTYANYMNRVSQMTQTMGRVSAIDMSESSKNSLLAQLHCGRGWLTYILYNLYGGLQLASLMVFSNHSLVLFINLDLNLHNLLMNVIKFYFY